MVKRFMCMMLILSIMICLIPITVAAEETEGELSILANAPNPYQRGDIVTYGSYPQTLIDDETMIQKLNSCDGEWVSYNFPDGVGETCYKDVYLDGYKYRAVEIKKYRKYGSYGGGSASRVYYENTIYWFKFEDLKWKILDPASGLAVSEIVIDSYEYNHTSYNENGHYANNYVYSDIRKWLLDSFIDIAFTEEQKSNLLENAIDNSASNSTYSSETTNDKVFLLSMNEVNTYMSEIWNRAKWTDYAQAQGLAIDQQNFATNWMLRTAASPGYSIYYVHDRFGYGDYYIPYYNWYDDVIFCSHLGVRPAVYFKNIPKDDNETDSDHNEDGIGYELGLYNATFENYYRDNMAGGADVEFYWGWSLFEQDPAQYDHRIAKASLLLSNVVYDNEEKIRKQFKSLGFSDTDTKLKLYNFTEDTYLAPATTISSQTYTVEGNEKTVISIVVRGTQNGADLLTDAIDGGLGGFTDSALFVYRCLEDYCNENNIILNDENTILFITGHSLGGATTGRMAVLLKKMGYKATTFVYAFAPARYDNEGYQSSDFPYVHNIINKDDFVPKVAPWFTHVGKLYYYFPGEIKFYENKMKLYGEQANSINDFLFEHYLATYLYCILTEEPIKNLLINGVIDYDILSIQCPVDIRVLDTDGNIIGYTEGQTVKNNNIESAIIMLNGDEKYVYLPAGSNCTIQMIGTDDGMMEYMVQSYNEYMEPIETKIFNNVKLNPGKQFKSVVSSETVISDVQLWIMNENEDIVAEVTEDGQEIPNNLDEGKCNIKGIVFNPGGISDPITVQLIDSNNNIAAETSIADNGTNPEYELINLKTGCYTLKTSGKNYVTREYSLEVNERMVVQNIELFHIGDINGDGSVNVLDNKVLYNHIEGISVLDGYNLVVADVNGDGSVNVLDNKVFYNHIEGISPLW